MHVKVADFMNIETSEVQSLVYIINNSLATQCNIVNMKTFGFVANERYVSPYIWIKPHVGFVYCCVSCSADFP